MALKVGDRVRINNTDQYFHSFKCLPGIVTGCLGDGRVRIDHDADSSDEECKCEKRCSDISCRKNWIYNPNDLELIKPRRTPAKGDRVRVVDPTKRDPTLGKLPPLEEEEWRGRTGVVAHVCHDGDLEISAEGVNCSRYFRPEALELIEADEPVPVTPCDCAGECPPAPKQTQEPDWALSQMEKYNALRAKVLDSVDKIYDLEQRLKIAEALCNEVFSRENLWPREAVLAVQERDNKIHELEQQLGEWMTTSYKCREAHEKFRRCVNEERDRAASRSALRGVLSLVIMISGLVAALLAMS